MATLTINIEFEDDSDLEVQKNMLIGVVEEKVEELEDTLDGSVNVSWEVNDD